MLYPSVDSLKNKIDSKYSLVSVASKRARQLQEEGGERLTSYVSDKQVGKALEEVAAGELTIESSNENTVYEDEV
ncbi:DNA-directed RNA polymerase subunit omega [Psychrobacillus vulpis]|uniref:DNA-directed RNA polymerase subunit omega n=1 Tax=Psychrobacillus vulpis TaxID=2325572 RepID=A0A544TTX4_9BACI|nr:DNA-directed RNA polymerase subunit omega [Psychrobacillus vulpis]TQR20870.1 DNA-directed RNA polymerase subunit omega [Psychrobacillus vulpis]